MVNPNKKPPVPKTGNARMSTLLSLAELYPMVRKAYDEELGEDVSSTFDEDTVMLYTMHNHDERNSISECIKFAVNTARSRVNMRPGSGDKDERPNAHKDDLWGCARDAERRKKISDEHEAVKRRLMEKGIQVNF